MASNIEIKAGVADLARVRALIEKLDVQERFRLTQTDTFFQVPNGRLKLREFGDGSAELIAYDRPDRTGPKLSCYQKVSIPEPAALIESLAMTLGVRGVVRKEREVLRVGQTRVHLDEVAGLGPFIELEVVLRDGQSDADGERIAQRLLGALEIAPGELVSCAYIDLLETK